MNIFAVMVSVKVCYIKGKNKFTASKFTAFTG